MAGSPLRTTNLPLSTGAATEVLAHVDIGGGVYALRRQALEVFVQRLLGLAGLDPSGVADLSIRVTQEIAARIAADKDLDDAINAEVLRATEADDALRDELGPAIADAVEKVDAFDDRVKGLRGDVAGSDLYRLTDLEGFVAYRHMRDGGIWTALLSLFGKLGVDPAGMLTTAGFSVSGEGGYFRVTDAKGFALINIEPGKPPFLAGYGYLTPRAEAASAWDPTPILPKTIFGIAGQRLPIFLSNIQTLRSDDARAIGALASPPATNGGGAYLSEGRETLWVDFDRMGSTAMLNLRPLNQPADLERRWQVPLSIVRAPAGTGQAIKILIIGDSIENRQVTQLLKDKLIAAGFAPTFIGTLPTAGQPDSNGDTDGPLAEARPGWASTDFVYSIIDSDVVSIVQPGGEAAYLSASKGQKFGMHPLLRAATGSDSASIVRNGYVFDLAFYLQRFNLATPDVVLILTGTNDVGERGANAAADVADAHSIMIPQIRKAGANIRIGLGMPTLPRAITGDDRWTAHAAVLRRIVATKLASSDPYLSVIGAWASQSQEAGWELAATPAASATTGVKTAAISDILHPDLFGRHQLADVLAGYCACAARGLI